MAYAPGGVRTRAKRLESNVARAHSRRKSGLATG
jgi:hypothetical protein